MKRTLILLCSLFVVGFSNASMADYVCYGSWGYWYTSSQFVNLDPHRTRISRRSYILGHAGSRNSNLTLAENSAYDACVRAHGWQIGGGTGYSCAVIGCRTVY